MSDPPSGNATSVRREPSTASWERSSRRSGSSSREAFRTGRAVGQEYVLALAQGEREYDVRLVRLGPDEVLALARDVTDARRAETLKDEFVSTVSHELRTPLTTVRGAIGLLLGGAVGELPEAAEPLLARADAGARKLEGLIGDLLDLQQLSAGRLDYRFEIVELRTFVQEAVERHHALASGHGIRIRSELPPPGVRIEIDRQRLHQVVSNLIANALRYSPRGGEIALEASATVDRVEIAVADRGPGVPQEFRPRLFEPFSIADATDRRERGGAGLGLGLAQRICTSLGGSLHLDETHAPGARFVIGLARAPEGSG